MMRLERRAMKNVGFISRPDVLAGRLLEAALLLEQQDAEAVEAGVAQRLAVLGDVHAEAARAAGAGGEEHVVLDDVLDRHASARRAGRSGTSPGCRR